MDSVIGLLPGQWFKLLKENRFKARPARMALISALTVRNHRFLAREKKIYPGKTTVNGEHAPVFIIGHWRSGTTFLHNLLSRDEQFTFPRTFQVNNPHTFLHIHQKYNALLRERTAKKRSMDNVKVSLLSPAEDEFALAALTLRSPIVGWLFPQRQTHYDRYTTFETCNRELLENWGKSYIHFFNKILFMTPGKRILSKSPLNTARIKKLHEIFPAARFIFLHRHPYEVFNSTIRLYDTAIARSSLQKPDYDVTGRIIERYRQIHSAYLEQRALIPGEKLLEISYDELDKEPLKTVEKIYRYHGLSGYEDFKPGLSTHLNGLSYTKNKYPALSRETVDKIQRHWEPYLQEWNYKL